MGESGITSGFSSLVASTAALIATGWSEPVPGRVYSRCGPPPFHGAPDNPGGLNGSLQHSLAVYLPVSQNPRSFADVGLSAAQSCRVPLAYGQTSPFF